MNKLYPKIKSANDKQTANACSLSEQPYFAYLTVLQNLMLDSQNELKKENQNLDYKSVEI